jgi:type III pantothenate kinase
MSKKSDALLAVDIGNTTISFGAVRANRILATADVETHLPAKELQRQLGRTLGVLQKRFAFEGAIICSVVPPVLKSVKSALQRNLPVKPVVVGEDLRVPLINRYHNPRQVGPDRLVGAFAAMKLYGLPAIVIDFGTAITFDVVSRKKEYLGGIIVPGIRLSAESLFLKTALIPRIDIVKPGPLIGKNTQQSVLSGIFYGYGAMSRGLIDELAKQIKGKPQVIVTGGYTKPMKKYIARQITKEEPHLVFKGLFLLWKAFRTSATKPSVR